MKLSTQIKNLKHGESIYLSLNPEKDTDFEIEIFLQIAKEKSKYLPPLSFDIYQEVWSFDRMADPDHPGQRVYQRRGYVHTFGSVKSVGSKWLTVSYRDVFGCRRQQRIDLSLARQMTECRRITENGKEIFLGVKENGNKACPFFRFVEVQNAVSN
ncbi:MAG: hypothetical protein CMC15_17670 [Flavobacteriaceae bacterium]|nr:hypothetical protein [Flavobacteriaceae bacterium]